MFLAQGNNGSICWDSKTTTAPRRPRDIEVWLCYVPLVSIKVSFSFPINIFYKYKYFKELAYIYYDKCF